MSLKTERDQALFELGIKLGALYHMAVNRPLPNAEGDRAAVARGLEASIGTQPFVEKVRVWFEQTPVVRGHSGKYDYGEITGENLRATVTLRVGEVRVVGTLAFDPDLHYPLMRIQSIEHVPGEPVQDLD